MSAVERHPNHTVAIDVHAANSVSRHRHLVDFRKCRIRRVRSGADADDVAGVRQARSPDRTVGWTKGDPIKRKGNACVLVPIQRAPGSLLRSSRLPLPLVSTIRAVQPWDAAASPVCRYLLVLTQPTT